MINLTVYTAVTCTYGSRKPTVFLYRAAAVQVTRSLEKSLHERYFTMPFQPSCVVRGANAGRSLHSVRCQHWEASFHRTRMLFASMCSAALVPSSFIL